jgi:hypothetical protein
MSSAPASVPAGRTLDAALQLLDRQILDCNQQPVAKVDDVELTLPDDGGYPVVTALLCGPAAWGPRLGGRLGNWVVSVHRRFTCDDRPVRIPFEYVKRVDYAVDLTIDRDASGALELERWARNVVIARLPGASKTSRREGRERDERDEQVVERADEPALRLSSLIGVHVRDPEADERAEVHDVLLVQDGPVFGAFGAGLRVHGLLAGSGSAWARLGFDRPRVRGPWLLKQLARRAAKSTRFVPWEGIDLDALRAERV